MLEETTQESVEETPIQEEGIEVVSESSDEESQETEATEVEEAEAETTESSEPQLYKLPDGREVDPDTLYKEYSENLLPEFTRRSQELAQLKQTPTQSNQPASNYWEDPSWQPATMEEFYKGFNEKMAYEKQLKEQETLTAKQQAEESIKTQLETLKQKDKTLNESELIAHAHKYKFSNLEVAYDNLQEIKGKSKTVEKRVMQNIAKRNDEPVAGKVSGSGSSVGVNYKKFSSAVDALDYVRGVK